MIVNVIDKQLTLVILPDLVRSIVEKVLEGEKQKCDEVSVYFIDTTEMCDLHEQFFDDPSPTDCISFPMDAEDEELGYRILGDVFVCPETAVKYAENHSKTDPWKETTLYVIHGILHLLGYDDIEEEDLLLMRRAETKYMNKLKKLNLQLSFYPNKPIK